MANEYPDAYLAGGARYGPTILRIFIGLLFLYTGVTKLLNPSMAAGEFNQLGFPVPMVFGWILLLSEIIFGFCVLIGFQVRWTIWPLVIILVGAIVTVWIPMISKGFSTVLTILFHLITIAGLLSIFLTGAGGGAATRGDTRRTDDGTAGDRTANDAKAVETREEKVRETKE